MKDFIKNKLTKFIKSLLEDDETTGHDLLNSAITTDFNDRYATTEQKERDKKITILLESYINAYKSKIKVQKFLRFILFIVCISIIVGFAWVFISKIKNIDFITSSIEVSNLVSLISICATFIASVVGILHTIAKYCFPENDEKYITDIVKAVQENDFNNKKAIINLEHQLENLAKSAPLNGSDGVNVSD